MLEIRKATPDDTENVLDFYHAMIDEMHGTNFDVLWKRDVHPSDAFLRESVEQGFMIIGIAPDGNIASALVIDRTSAPGYEKIPWASDAPDEQVGILHSVATRPAYQGNGYAYQLLRASIELAKEDGLRSLRLDTFVDNERSHGLYAKVGFIYHGSWPLYYDDLGTIDFDMFEYVIED